MHEGTDTKCHIINKSRCGDNRTLILIVYLVEEGIIIVILKITYWKHSCYAKTLTQTRGLIINFKKLPRTKVSLGENVF